MENEEKLQEKKEKYIKQQVDLIVHDLKTYKHKEVSAADYSNALINFEEAVEAYSEDYPSLLSDRDIKTLKYRMNGATLEETGKHFGVTRERIRQYEMRIIKKICSNQALCVYIFLGADTARKQISLKAQAAKKGTEFEVKMKELEECIKAAQALIDKFQYKLPDISKEAETISLENLNFTVRTYNILRRSNIRTLSDLLKLSSHDIFCMRNMGRKSAREIREKVKEYTGVDYFKEL